MYTNSSAYMFHMKVQKTQIKAINYLIAWSPAKKRTTQRKNGHEAQDNTTVTCEVLHIENAPS